MQFRILLALPVLLTLALTPSPARACTWGIEPWPCQNFTDMDAWWAAQDFTQAQKNFLKNDFYQKRILDELFKDHILPSLQAMTAQMIGARVHMTGAIGGFIDGQSLVETQLVMKKLEAQALRDYTPGENLCRLGTSVRSLGAADFRAESVRYALGEMAEDRLMNTLGGSSDGGTDMDIGGRFNQFARVYCNPGDNNGLMKQICYPKQPAPTSQAERMNKDIDFARTLDQPMTLDLNFTDAALTPDEEDIIALSSNLYAHNIFGRLPAATFEDTAGDRNKPTYLDLRQVAALRSVAQHSFNAQVAQRARGASGSSAYLFNVLKELGMSDVEAKKLLASNTGEPSYHAQMEILTKKIYQNPNFYVNLVDKPANVKRQLAAMDAIALTQNRDLFESLERQEMLLSLLLELEIRAEQQFVASEANNATRN